MGFYAADANGFIADVASTTGLHDFSTEAEAHPGTIATFAEAGETDDPEALAAALAAVTFQNLSAETVRQAILGCAQRAAEVLILSDGADTDEDDAAFVDDTPDMSALRALDQEPPAEPINEYRTRLQQIATRLKR
jgi:hypothetical protein